MFSGLNDNEIKKIAAFELLRRKDSELDAVLADFAILASKVMGVTGCFISIFNDGIEYIKFSSNIQDLPAKTPITESLHSIYLSTSPHVICSDASKDPRFLDHHLVKSEHIIFYASVPFTTIDGCIRGALSVSEKHSLTPDQDAINGFLRIASLISSYIESWYSLGKIDPLTGLPNRNCLLQEINELKQKRDQSSFTLIIFDCIDMSRTYELYRYLGATVVENMLRSFPSLLRVLLNLDEKVTLYTFATGRHALLISTGLAGPVLDRSSQLSLTNAIITENIEIQISIFTGYVSFIPSDLTAQEILRRGVSALHEAIGQSFPVKEFDIKQDDSRNYKSKLFYDLSEAIKSEKQIYLVYQPKIALISEKIVAAEALLRWEHPSLGNISPALIISIVQKTSIMNDITNWVVKEVIRQLCEWRKKNILIPVSINFAASDLSKQGFATELERKIIDSGLSPSDIRIECLETEELITKKNALHEISTLKNKGFKILIDDFGAGYSNLTYLRSIPADIIKLDRSITNKILFSETGRIIAKNVIIMLKELGYTVLAEGVEDKDTAIILKFFGCDEAQGYYYSKPLKPDDLIRWISKN